MGIFSFLKGGKNPADAAQPYLNQIPGAITPHYQPYAQRGQEAGNQAYGQYQNMTDNPSDFINQLLSQYNPSKGFEFGRDQALQAMRNSAAAGGNAGTEADQIRQGELATALGHKDIYDWLDRVLGQHGEGLKGLGHLQNQGYEADTGLGDILGGVLNQQGGLAFQGQAQKNKDQGNLTKILAQALAGAGGFAIGGPTGAYAGSKIATDIW